MDDSIFIDHSRRLFLYFHLLRVKCRHVVGPRKAISSLASYPKWKIQMVKILFSIDLIGQNWGSVKRGISDYQWLLCPRDRPRTNTTKPLLLYYFELQCNITSVMVIWSFLFCPIIKICHISRHLSDKKYSNPFYIFKTRFIHIFGFGIGNCHNSVIGFESHFL